MLPDRDQPTRHQGLIAISRQMEDELARGERRLERGRDLQGLGVQVLHFPLLECASRGGKSALNTDGAACRSVRFAHAPLLDGEVSVVGRRLRTPEGSQGPEVRLLHYPL